MNRREVLTLGVGAALASALPQTAVAALDTGPGIMPVVGTNMPNTFDATIRMIGLDMGLEEEQIGQIQRLNRVMLQTNPDVFFLDYQAPAPTFVYVDEDDRYDSGMVKSLMLEKEWPLEVIDDLKHIQGLDAEEIALNQTIEAVGEELRRLQENLAEDKQIAWYVPLWPVTKIHEVTFVPSLGFKTRYALIPALARVTNT